MTEIASVDIHDPPGIYPDEFFARAKAKCGEKAARIVGQNFSQCAKGGAMPAQAIVATRGKLTKRFGSMTEAARFAGCNGWTLKRYVDGYTPGPRRRGKKPLDLKGWTCAYTCPVHRLEVAAAIAREKGGGK